MLLAGRVEEGKERQGGASEGVRGHISMNQTSQNTGVAG